MQEREKEEAKREALKKASSIGNLRKKYLKNYDHFIYPFEKYPKKAFPEDETAEDMSDRLKMVRRRDLIDRETYERAENSTDKDFFFLLKRIYVKDIGKMFRINVPDCYLYNKAEPIMQLYSVDPKNYITKIERKREKLQANELKRFFTKRRHFGIYHYDYDIEEVVQIKGKEVVQQKLIMVQQNIDSTIKYLIENELVLLLNKSRKQPEWRAVQIIYRMIQSRNPPRRIKFEIAEIPNEDSLMKRAH